MLQFLRYIAFALLGSVLLCQTAQAKYPLAYVGPPDARDASLSPDGSQVAVLMTTYKDGQQTWDTLKIVSSETGEIVNTFHEEYRIYEWVLWAFDDTLITHAQIFKFSRRKVKSQNVILAINVKTGEEKILAATRKLNYKTEREAPKILGVSQDTRSIAILSSAKNKTNLQIVNIDTGTARDVAKGNSKTVSWQLNKDLLPILRTDHGKYDHIHNYYSKDKTTNKWQIIATRNLLRDDFKPIAISENSQQLMVVARPNGTNLSGLYEYDLINRQYSKALYEHTKFDLSNVTYASFDDGPLYASWWDDKLEKHWFDKDKQKLAESLDRSLNPNDSWRILETSRDQTTWLVYVSSPLNPGGYQVWDTKSKTLKPISEDRPGLEPNVLSQPKRINYQARDGLQLFGYFTPALKETQKAPLIVMPHGGPVVRDRMDWDGWAQFFAFKGYSVFQPQFRGSGGFGRAFEQKGHLQWGKSMQTDIEDGVAALEKRGMVALESQRAILGVSYGGYAALVAATTTPDAYNCVISVNGVSDVIEFLNGFDVRDPVEASAFNIWTQRIGDLKTQRENLATISPARHADRITARLYLIHGSADQIVPVEQSRLMHKAAQAANIRVVYNEIEGLGHNNWWSKKEIAILSDISWNLTMCIDK